MNWLSHQLRKGVKNNVELIMSLEEEFSNPSRKVEIPDEDAEKMVTVQDAVDYIRAMGGEDD